MEFLLLSHGIVYKWLSFLSTALRCVGVYVAYAQIKGGGGLFESLLSLKQHDKKLSNYIKNKPPSADEHECFEWISALALVRHHSSAWYVLVSHRLYKYSRLYSHVGLRQHYATIPNYFRYPFYQTLHLGSSYLMAYSHIRTDSLNTMLMYN